MGQGGRRYYRIWTYKVCNEDQSDAENMIMKPVNSLIREDKTILQVILTTSIQSRV
jgi:hypothetical protein